MSALYPEAFRPSDALRTGIIAVGGGLLVVFRGKYLTPVLPETITSTILVWVIMIVMAKAVSLFWENAGAVRAIVVAGVLSALVASVPVTRAWIAGPSGVRETTLPGAQSVIL